MTEPKHTTTVTMPESLHERIRKLGYQLRIPHNTIIVEMLARGMDDYEELVMKAINTDNDGE